MTDDRLGRKFRAIRLAKGWRQSDFEARAGVSDSVICDIEYGRIERVSIPTLRKVAAALDAGLVVDLRWRGGELDRLLDADHARLQEAWVRRLNGMGWLCRSEVTFNRYGDRGSIDVLAFHSESRVLLTIEVKTGLYDAQDLLRRMDVKERVAREVAGGLGWHAGRVVPALVLAESRTNRRRIDQFPALFARYEARGRRALAWLRDPQLTVGGLLVIARLPDSVTAGGRRAGRQRMRLRRGVASVGGTPHLAPSRSLEA